MGFLAAAALAVCAAAAFAALLPAPRRSHPAEAAISGYALTRQPQDIPPPPAVPRMPRALALRLSRPGVGESLQRRLATAGEPAGWTADRVLGVKGLAMLAGAALGAVYGLHNPVILAAGFGGGAAAGFFVPDVILYNAGAKRREKIVAALPDAVDLLTICVQAGLGFDQALGRVASVTPGPLGAELSRALGEIQIGQSRSAALHALATRAAVTDLRSFVSSVVQSGELGIPVSQVLREQAAQMRDRRQQRAEARAQQVSVKVLFPLLFCLFPALFIIVIGPAALTVLHTLSGG